MTNSFEQNTLLKGRDVSVDAAHAGCTSALRETLDRWRQELLGQRAAREQGDAAHWEGQLSPSALSTATAVSALATVLIYEPQDSVVSRQTLRELIVLGLRYLHTGQNEDGGFGDTDRSRSNIATTLLVLAAQRLAGQALSGQEASAGREGLAAAQVRKAEWYVERAGGWDGLRRRYGKDKTFVVPILTNCAIAGMVEWQRVPSLPFEAAVFPQSMYRFLRMPVVSYAIPALVAIGQVRFLLGPKPLPPVRWVRAAAVQRTMKVLGEMQPESGGYLEATPLTSFVLMSLAASGRGDSKVARSCIRFLVESVLDDGSWPIDTNLATFVTSLAIHGLRSDPDDDASWMSDALVDWHLRCQHTARHPYTGAAPGGWGWSDLSGAVPDGDDTPGAILALHACREARWSAAPACDEMPIYDETIVRIDQATEAGCRWLLQLQNGDGGWPTFCRGWGKLPFDRSSVDLTAHALRALHQHLAAVSESAHETTHAADFQRSIDRGWQYLEATQRPDGSWLPLWFGNHDQPDDENPFYGTGRVLLAIGEAGKSESPMAARACQFLLDRQNPDGGWGGGTTLTRWLQDEGLPARDAEWGVEITSSLEETAVVLEGLAAILERPPFQVDGAASRAAEPSNDQPEGAGRFVPPGDPLAEIHRPVGGEQRLRASILAGCRFLDQAIRHGRHRTPWPIGFYFAKLWYHERLYPAVFATAALARVLKVLRAGDTGLSEAAREPRDPEDK